MFTGIVAGIGTISALQLLAGEARMLIEPDFTMAALVDGESIAVDGVCLSVETHDGNNFTAYASGETLSRTTLRQLSVGSRVNLERALAVGERLGGHIVTGHIDCVAEVAQLSPRGESLLLQATFPSAYAPLVIAKGSVALNGISLTVNECGERFLEVNVIPESQKRTNLLDWRPGTRVNMETDILGKYVRHLLAPWQSGASGGLSRDFLSTHGFI